MDRISSQDCASATGVNEVLCQEIVDLSEKQDDIQTQIYIISGAVGGVLLILFILVITLFVKLSRSFNRVSNGDELAKRGFATYTGQPVQQAAINPTVTPSPVVPFTPASPTSNVFGYDNKNFEQQSSNRQPSHTANQGGVRVLPTLPRNPPILRNLNQQQNQNDAYY